MEPLSFRRSSGGAAWLTGLDFESTTRKLEKAKVVRQQTRLQLGPEHTITVFDRVWMKRRKLPKPDPTKPDAKPKDQQAASGEAYTPHKAPPVQRQSLHPQSSKEGQPSPPPPSRPLTKPMLSPPREERLPPIPPQAAPALLRPPPIPRLHHWGQGLERALGAGPSESEARARAAARPPGYVLYQAPRPRPRV
jgi:hypothetical protein